MSYLVSENFKKKEDSYDVTLVSVYHQGLPWLFHPGYVFHAWSTCSTELKGTEAKPPALCRSTQRELVVASLQASWREICRCEKQYHPIHRGGHAGCHSVDSQLLGWCWECDIRWHCSFCSRERISSTTDYRYLSMKIPLGGVLIMVVNYGVLNPKLPFISLVPRCQASWYSHTFADTKGGHAQMLSSFSLSAMLEWRGNSFTMNKPPQSSVAFRSMLENRTMLSNPGFYFLYPEHAGYRMENWRPFGWTLQCQGPFQKTTWLNHSMWWTR